jgi:hypothetical protein
MCLWSAFVMCFAYLFDGCIEAILPEVDCGGAPIYPAQGSSVEMYYLLISLTLAIHLFSYVDLSSIMIQLSSITSNT